MKSFIEAICGVLLLGGLLLVLPSLASVQFGNPPIVKRLSTFRGDVCAGFAGFRVQEVKFDQAGVMTLVSAEPYEVLINVNYITKMHRFEDAKNTDYSCLMFFDSVKNPLLVRMPYKDVYSAIRRAADAQVK